MNRFLTSRILLSLMLLLLTAGVVFLLGSCSGGSTPAPGSAPAEPVPAAEPSPGSSTVVASYQVRGEVVELPDPDDPLSGFYVRHEAVDDFLNMEGEVQGMDSMTMPFSVADDVSFEGISVGDAVTFILTVDWDGDPAVQVTAVEKLPEGTQLEFREARVPEAAQEGETTTSGHDDAGH